jgi:TPR repeat protein
LSQGDIATARLFLERVANDNGEAAFLLGQTYDAAALTRLGAIGIAPEPQNARRWYTLAQQKGFAAAEASLRALGN